MLREIQGRIYLEFSERIVDKSVMIDENDTSFLFIEQHGWHHSKLTHMLKLILLIYTKAINSMHTKTEKVGLSTPIQLTLKKIQTQLIELSMKIWSWNRIAVNYLTCSDKPSMIWFKSASLLQVSPLVPTLSTLSCCSRCLRISGKSFSKNSRVFASLVLKEKRRRLKKLKMLC